MNTNEIRDYVERAPKRWRFEGGRMVNHTHVRYKWLAELALGTIDSKINRRAGIVDKWEPFKNPTWKAIRRHNRKMHMRRFGWSPLD